MSASTQSAQPLPVKVTSRNLPTVALAGNPNCGKTTLFNSLTGAYHTVGNYPGVTVERRSGTARGQGLPASGVSLIDLPGTYSLSAWSPEERIAQQELLGGQLDAVVVVVDSTNLARGLQLLAQVLLTGSNPVLCLNMSDEAGKAGQRLDLEQMRRLLEIPVVETSGKLDQGIGELREAIQHALEHPKDCRRRVTLGLELRDALDRLEQHLDKVGIRGPQVTWMALKLLKEDPDTRGLLNVIVEESDSLFEEAAREKELLQKGSGQDIHLYIGSQLSGFASGLVREVTLHLSREDARRLSDTIDSVLANKVLGLPIFLAIMYGIFWITFSMGEAPMGWIEGLFGFMAEAVSGLWPAGSDSLLRSLLVDGILAGVGGVMVFLPNIVLLFAGLAILEDTGYMARAAFIMDRVMHRFGLHGQSFLPLMTGFGCSIPGIMATRTLENERDRLVTMLVLPLMSCGARLPIWMLLIPAFFAPPWRAPALWGIYMTGILLALVFSLLLRRTVLRGEEAPFVMELPPYRMPTLRAILYKMYDRSRSYVIKAGTIILGVSIVLWAMTSFPGPPEQPAETGAPAGIVEVQENLDAADALRYSLAGRLGVAMEPLFSPLGFDWRINTALIGAFAAKEVFVAQMGIVFALGETDENSVELSEALRSSYSPLVGISLMLFLLIATPCMATVAIMKKETGSWKYAWGQFIGLSVFAWLLSLAVFQLGSLFL